MKALTNFFSSFGLACVLLLCMFFLTLFGTLYQDGHHLNEAKQVFFSSWLLWADVGGFSLPYFPGGMLCMLLLSINLIVGGVVRIRIRLRNIGVVIIHLGVVVMLVAGLVKLFLAEEGKIQLFEGESTNYFDSYYRWEVAVWDLDGGPDQQEFVIGDSLFADLEDDSSRLFTAKGLPFALELSGFLLDCRALRKGPNWQASGSAIDGFGLFALPDAEREETSIAGLHGRALVDGRIEESLLWGAQFQPWTVHAGGKRWAVDMRHERYSMPFVIRLEEFEHETFRGNGMDKAFRSTVTKIQGDQEERVLIQMNEPLRDQNLVLFQSRYGVDEDRGEYTVLSTVRNISDKWPEWMTYVITFGMLIAFGSKLVGFASRESRRRGKLELEA